MDRLTPDPAGILRAAARDKDFGFEVTANWKDVQRKAKRIRAEGGVTIVVASNDGIGGQVKGDKHTYEAILLFRPGTHKVADWTCGCAWAAYAFDRSPAFRRFEGRKCSHALALQFEAQSQGMFGKEIHPAEPPEKVPTVVKYDPDDGRSVFARPYEGSLAAVAVARLRAEEADPAEVIGQLIQTGMKHTAARDLWKDAERRHEGSATASHQVWFHGTPSEHVDDIREHGVRKSTSDWDLRLTDSKDQAAVYARRGGGEGKVLEYHVPEGHPAIGPRYPHNLYGQNAHAVSLNEPLPSAYLVHEHTAARELWKSAGSLGPQKCADCDKAATKALMWAEHMAYVPVCDDHRQAAAERLEAQGDEVEAVRDLPQKTAEREAKTASGYWHGTDRDLDDQGYLLPPSRSGQAPNHHDDEADRDRVFMTDSPEDARQWGQHVYEVSPRHEPDEDDEHVYSTDGPVRIVRRHGGSHEAALDLVDAGELGPVLAAKEDEPPGPKVSGIALKAHDTGRVLMLQRGLEDEKDPAAGTWEFPGGHHEDGDLTSLHAGIREFQEEVGQEFPAHGVVKHTWTSPDGVYQGHVVVVPSEKDLSMKDGRVTVNPDDPKGDHHEQAAWWSVDHAKKNPALRPEVKAHTPWKEIEKASLDTAKTASSWDPISNTTVTQPGRNLSEPQHSTSKNPVSTGFATSEDPSNWDNVDVGPTSGGVTPAMSFDSTLHEHPEPALPSTDGTAEYHPEIGQEDLDPIPDNPAAPDPYEPQSGIVMDEAGTATPNTYHSSLDGGRPLAEIVADFQKSAGAQALMVPEHARQDTDDIAAAARAHLSKTALADFSPEEQRELINENPDARARNFADLKLDGSHYALLEEAMANGDVDPSGLFL